MEVFGLGGVLAHAVKEDDFRDNRDHEALLELVRFLHRSRHPCSQDRLAGTGDFTEHGKVIEFEEGYLVKLRIKGLL